MGHLYKPKKSRQAKNEDGRVVYLPGYLKPQLAEQIERIKGLERETGRIIPSLFAHPTNGRRHKKGDPIRDFKKTWASACRKAGCPGMLRHDFRRTAVRDMVNDGVSERVAMTITGHKTRSVFDRYHIVSPADLQEAARKRETARRSHRHGDTYGDTAGRRGDEASVTMRKIWWTMQDLNLRPPACEAGALPTELIVRACDLRYLRVIRQAPVCPRMCP
jgi:hypothetical protein